MCITIVWCVSNTRLFCKVSNNLQIVQVFEVLAKDNILQIGETNGQIDIEIMSYSQVECYNWIK